MIRKFDHSKKKFTEACGITRGDIEKVKNLHSKITRIILDGVICGNRPDGSKPLAKSRSGAFEQVYELLKKEDLFYFSFMLYTTIEDQYTKILWNKRCKKRINGSEMIHGFIEWMKKQGGQDGKQL